MVHLVVRRWHISETIDGRLIKTWMTRTRQSGFLIAVRRRYVKLRRHGCLLKYRDYSHGQVGGSVLKNQGSTKAGRVRRPRGWNVLLGLRSNLPDGIAKELGLLDEGSRRCQKKLPLQGTVASPLNGGPEQPLPQEQQRTRPRLKLVMRTPLSRQPSELIKLKSESSEGWTEFVQHHYVAKGHFALDEVPDAWKVAEQQFLGKPLPTDLQRGSDERPSNAGHVHREARAYIDKWEGVVPRRRWREGSLVPTTSCVLSLAL